MDGYLSELKARAIRRGKGEVTARFGLNGAKDIGCATASVFVVASAFPSGWAGEAARTSACNVTGFLSKQTTGSCAS
jgi:hypothetical protein